MMKTIKMKNRLFPLLLALALVLSLIIPAAAASTESATAAAIRLTKAEGTVSIKNGDGKKLTRINKMRLYSGYSIETAESSYAWINLDDAKLIKQDAASKVQVHKSGKSLEVKLESGGLFFNVTEPLAADESLNISTSTMIVGIRGTSGWIRVAADGREAYLSLGEGTAQLSVTDPVSGQTKSGAIHGGEQAKCVVYPQGHVGDKCDILMDGYQVQEIPGFVLYELVRDMALCDKILEETGTDILRELAKVAGGDPSGRASAKAATPELLGFVKEKQQQESERQEAQGTQSSRPSESSDSSSEPASSSEPDSSSDSSSEPASSSEPGSSSESSSEPTSSSEPGSSSESSSDSSSEPTASSEPDSSSESSSSPDSAILPVAVFMPQTVSQLKTLLNGETAENGEPRLTVQPGENAGQDTLIIDAALSVPSGKTLEAASGVPVEVSSSGALTVDGTMEVAGNLTFSGRLTVNSSNTLRVGGSLISNGGTLVVSQTGRVVVEGALQGGCTLEFAEGGRLLAKAFSDAFIQSLPSGLQVSAGADASGYYTIEKSAAPAAYTVSFHANGGAFADGSDTATAQTPAGGGQVTFPAEPTRTGHTFAGWYTAAEGGTVAGSTQSFFADASIYAHWEPIRYTVTFDADGGLVEGGGEYSISAPYGTKLSEICPADPTREGYLFQGWWLRDPAEGAADLDAAVSGDITLCANWAALYTVTFDADGGLVEGKATHSVSVPVGTKLSEIRPADPTREGYLFQVWWVREPAEGVADLDAAVSGDMTLYANWSIAYIATFHGNGGTIDGKETYQVTAAENSALLSLRPSSSLMEREGYKFDNWYNDPVGGDFLLKEDVLSADSDLYAHWTPIEYTVTFDANGGTFADGETVITRKVAYGGSIPTDISEPTKENAAFVTWYESETMEDMDPNSKVTQDITFKALWSGVSSEGPTVSSSDSSSEPFNSEPSTDSSSSSEPAP